MARLEGSPLLQGLKRLAQMEILHERDHLDLEPLPEHFEGPILRPRLLVHQLSLKHGLEQNRPELFQHVTL
jgi:hypothetical protein